MSMITDIISAYVSLLTLDDGAVQRMQGQGEQQTNTSTPQATPEMAVMLPYGFSAHPPNGSDVIAVQVEGRAEQTVIAVQHRPSRPKALTLGAVCLHILQGKILVYLDPDDETLHLGMKGATDWVSKATPSDANYDALKAELDKIVTTLGSGTTPMGGPVTFTTPYTNGFAPEPVGSTIVRVE